MTLLLLTAFSPHATATHLTAQLLAGAEPVPRIRPTRPDMNVTTQSPTRISTWSQTPTATHHPTSAGLLHINNTHTTKASLDHGKPETQRLLD
jgi:hypothetical protein